MTELLPGCSSHDRFNAHVMGLRWQGDRIGSDGFCLSFFCRGKNLLIPSMMKRRDIKRRLLLGSLKKNMYVFLLYIVLSLRMGNAAQLSTKIVLTEVSSC